MVIGRFDAAFWHRTLSCYLEPAALPWFVAAALWERAAKEPALTCPPLPLAALDWMRAAAWVVIGLDFAEDFADIWNLSVNIAQIGNGLKVIDRPANCLPRHSSKFFDF